MTDTFKPGDRCLWYCVRHSDLSGHPRIPVVVLKIVGEKARVREISTGRETLVKRENLMPNR